jgi:hypothetical protein
LQVKAQFFELMQNLQQGGALDTLGEYKVFSTLALASNHLNHPTLSLPDVTLSTQCSMQNLNEVVGISSKWQGPVTVAVFSENDNLDLTIWQIARLRVCNSTVRENVSFQLVTPSSLVINHRRSVRAPDTDASCDFQSVSAQGQNYDKTQVGYGIV